MPLTSSEMAHSCQVVREYPPRPAELASVQGLLSYICRLAVEMGFIPAPEGLRRWPGQEPVAPVEREVRMPYRDDVEEWDGSL